MKSTTKLILAGLGTAAVCAGVYYVIKNKDKFLKSEEVINPDGTAEKRTYVVLDVDGAKKKATSTIQKGKEKAQDTWKKVETGAKDTWGKVTGKGNEEMEIDVENILDEEADLEAGDEISEAVADAVDEALDKAKEVAGKAKEAIADVADAAAAEA
ncbi:MAG: hypothetical protein IIZ41_10050 [Lachnospiraceae bacterium]|jgi:hypothetical protein|nr:hypothetical protein [Lachnospiraceae bacterium]MBR3636825.1 hypothetical protein [Lachnospiraceae bacterium]